MNKIIRNIFLVLAVFVSAACSGNLDIPEGTLRIFADKTVITADGNDAVTFKVMFGSQDVSEAKTLQIIRTFDGEDRYMPYGANKFSTVTAGTYKFRAKYYYDGNHVTDNEVEVVAEQYFVGEEKNYMRRYFGTLFTSTGCTSCPVSSAALKELQAQNPGIISIVAFHSDFMVNDPMTIPETEDFKVAVKDPGGYPSFTWNMRPEAHVGGSANIFMYEQSLDEEKERYQTFSGVSINTAFDRTSSKLDIEVGITSNMPAVFRYVVILVEDNIPAVGDHEQSGDGEMSGYAHYNVARDVLTGARGDKLNGNLPLTVGVEAKAEKSVTVEAGWNPDNMRVIVAALTSEDGGYNWTVNNVNECKVGGSAPYLYEE